MTCFAPQAAAYSNEILTEGIGGGGEVVIEERLEGVEFTVQAITDGKSFLRVPITYDFPYLLDGDKGPGTGGMGSFCGPGTASPRPRGLSSRPIVRQGLQPGSCHVQVAPATPDRARASAPSCSRLPQASERD